MNEVITFTLGTLVQMAPWILLGTAAAIFISRSAFGKALTQRLREGSVRAEELAALVTELQQVRGELTEVQERLDFTERIVMQQRDALPPEAPSGVDTPTPPDLVPVGHP
jgi:hypothetical protein